MPFINSWIHFVWSTKNRLPYLKKEILNKMIFHIKDYGVNKDIYIDFVNGHFDHIHMLVSMKADQSISEIAQKIKGESSYWINKNSLTEIKFGWQNEYYAVSISSGDIHEVREYIRNQEKHHKNKTYDEEIEELQRDFNFHCSGFKPNVNYE